MAKLAVEKQATLTESGNKLLKTNVGGKGGWLNPGVTAPNKRAGQARTNQLGPPRCAEVEFAGTRLRRGP